MIDSKLVEKMNREFNLMKRHTSKNKMAFFKKYMSHEEEMTAFFMGTRHCYLIGFFDIKCLMGSCSDCKRDFMYRALEKEVNHIHE